MTIDIIKNWISAILIQMFYLKFYSNKGLVIIHIVDSKLGNRKSSLNVLRQEVTPFTKGI